MNNEDYRYAVCVYILYPEQLVFKTERQKKILSEKQELR